MRTEIERRLLLVACLGLIVGIAGKAQVWNLLLLIPLIALLRPAGAKAISGLACLAGVIVGPGPGAAPVVHSEFFKGVVKVETVPKLTKTGSSCEVASGSSRMVLLVPADRSVGLGDRLETMGVIDPPFESEERFCRSRGLLGRFRPAELRSVSEGTYTLKLAARLRDQFLSFSERTLSPRSASAVDALCFNVDADLDQDFRRNLSRTGTIHIISASGMHVVIFAFALLWLLSRLPVPRWLQLVVLSGVLLFYAGAAGLRPPVVRSVVMAMVVLSAYLWRREPDWLSAMALAAFGYLLLSPASLSDVGFQLSFAAVASLGLFGRFFGAGPLNSLKTAAHTSLVASVGSAPLVAYHFGMFSVVAVLANLLIGLVVAPIVIVAMGAMAIDPLLPGVSGGLMKLAVEPLSGWLMAVVDTMGPWRLSAVDTPPFSAYWLLPIYAAMLCLWRRRPVEG